MSYQVLYSTRAQTHLLELERYIVRRGSPDNARVYVEAIVARCEKLAAAPWQGTSRDDLLTGLRTTGFRKRVTIAFRVMPETVFIAGIFYGGKNVKIDL
jgi:toxin ParE1/3/4